jgi:copper transport protein
MVEVFRRARLSVPAGLLLALALLALSAGPAAAHATLLSTDPKNDAVLATAPAAVTLTFDEAVVVWPTSVSVFDPAGERVDVTVKGIDTRAVATLPRNLANGTYTVTWRVISADDHPVSGGFVFTIGARTTPVVPTPGSEPSASLNVLRLIATALGYLGVLGATGLAFFELVILAATPGAMPMLRRRLRLTGRGLIAAGALGFFASIPLTAAWQFAGGLSSLGDGAVWNFRSDTTISAALAIGGLLIAAASVVVSSRVGVAVGSLIALTSLPWTGHTRSYGPTWLVVASDLIHVSAGAIWAGGIIGLLLTLSRSSDASARRAAVTAARFSAVAAWAVLAIAIAGTVLAWRILGSVSGLWETSYGLALLVKLVVVVVIVGLAAWNRLGLLPRVTDQIARGRLRSVVLAEVVALVALLGVTGVLVTQPPKEEAAAGPSSPQRARGLEAALGDDLVRLRISPVSTGQNIVQVHLRDAQGNPLKPLSAPVVRFSLRSAGIEPIAAPLSLVGPGQYEGRVALPVAGDWTIQVSARTSKYESPSVELMVHIY